MEMARNPSPEAQAAAVLDWWRDAGVDALFHDDPTNWLPPPEDDRPALKPPPNLRRQKPAEETAPPSPLLGDLPATLAEFTTWWLAEPALDGGRTAGRVAPRGTADARLMVLVAEPERDDGEMLLSGPEGKLLDAMLAAMGLTPEEAYIASALPRHTPHPDWEAATAQGLGRVIAHHVALVRPQTLLSFGPSIPSLLGNVPPNNPALSRTFNHEGLTVPWIPDRSLGAMLQRPLWKAGFWQRWLSRSTG